MTCSHPSAPCLVCPIYRGDCPDCAEPLGRVPQQGYVCLQCRSLLRSQLTEIVQCAKAASEEIGLGKGANDGRSREQSLGLRVGALDLVCGHDVLPVLEEWEQAWRGLLGHATFGRSGVLSLRQRAENVDACMAWIVGYLLMALDAVCDRDDAGIREFAEEVRTQLSIARAAARSLPANQWRVSCPTTDCGRVLRIERADLDETITCEGCGQSRSVKRLLTVVAGDTDSEVWLPREDAALLIGVSESTLQRWAKQEDSHVRRRGGLYEYGSVRAHYAALAG